MTDTVARRMADAAVRVPSQSGQVMIQTPRRTRRPTPEERQFLDTLIFWRAIYAERGAQDTEPGADVWSTIAAAELRMSETRRHPLP